MAGRSSQSGSSVFEAMPSFCKTFRQKAAANSSPCLSPLRSDRIHQIADTMGLGIYDWSSVLPFEETVPLSADCIAVQVAKRLTRITIDIVHVLDFEDRSPEAVQLLDRIRQFRDNRTTFERKSLHREQSTWFAAFTGCNREPAIASLRRFIAESHSRGLPW
jgi:hypothetical protein